MLSWSQQRKFFWVGGVVLILAVVFSAYGVFTFYNPPDCFNGSKDGDERGVDCGGGCARACKADTVPPVVQFARAVEVAEGVWGAVAYLENKNTGVGARDVPYVFKLYDEDNLLLYERHGATFIPPRKSFAVFEGKMLSGDRVPTRASFKFLQEPIFLRTEEPELVVTTRGFTTDARSSSLQAMVTNPSSDLVEGIEATALLFGPDGNVTAASATRISRLEGRAGAMLVFTWPQVLEDPSRIEVLYTVPGRD